MTFLTNPPPFLLSNTNHLMFDIESMSTEPDAAILTIGAVPFNPRGWDDEESLRAKAKLFGPITLESNEAANRHISAGTVEWWLQQNPEAIKALFDHPVNLAAALSDFAKWIAAQRPALTHVWANSPNFDCTITERAMRALKITWPFKFYQYLDLRTIKFAAYPDGDCPKIGVGTAHNAVDDAIRQALTVQHCIHVLCNETEPQTLF